MKIITDTLTLTEIKEMAMSLFGDLVKAVVDVDKKILAVDAELHSDLETLLLENGSKQNNLWGINLYPDLPSEKFVEFDSLINMRPAQNNRSRGVESETIRKQIVEIVNNSVRK